MYLVVGLGNPGARYKLTRHNAGFMAVDQLAEKLSVSPGDWGEKHKGLFARAKQGEEELLLIKPLTFMNLSGEAILPWMQFFKVPPARVVVVVDEFSLPFGSLRVRPSGSDGGHNGLKSVQQHLGQGYPRVRIGVHGDPGMVALADYVLKDFTKEEQKALPRIAAAAADCVLDVLAVGAERAMNTWNGKKFLEESP